MKNVVIIDIDGTISKVGDRLKYLQQKPKDWDKFYEACDEDKPIWEIIELIHSLIGNYEIYYCTGRRESVRNKTFKWLIDWVSVSIVDEELLMRKDGDYRHDTEAKPELLKEAGIELDKIAFVLEDRNTMVKKWRSLGLTCLQVAEGDF